MPETPLRDNPERGFLVIQGEIDDAIPSTPATAVAGRCLVFEVGIRRALKTSHLIQTAYCIHLYLA
jgi:hypothetical protein